ncbi:MAG: hypothetical protein K0R27_1458 [Xanthobacteraceae bacterium]|nr:hypothetical protein [Xanthobacteraceae bacterium]
MGAIGFPKFEFSKKQVSRAGDALREAIVWAPDAEDDVREIFKIANSWRDSHLYPMAVMRRALIGHLARAKVKGLTAARIKRMPSIRKKLRKRPIKLDDIQDLAGCRAILNSIEDVNSLIQQISLTFPHRATRPDDYIAAPKKDGYRSYHIVFRFTAGADPDAAIFEGRKVEVQIRTRIQHAWATAVEAVGLFLGEDIKGGGGKPEWRRLFLLMSAELAVMEACNEPPDVSVGKDRIREIKRLNKDLKASYTLDKIAHAVNFIDEYIRSPSFQPEYYLIIYDNDLDEVAVSPMSGPFEGAASFDVAEHRARYTTVLVEADKIKSLKEAYPNYFGDVRLFRRVLRHICKGKAVKDFKLAPQKTVKIPPKEKPDMSWMRRSAPR